MSINDVMSLSVGITADTDAFVNELQDSIRNMNLSFNPDGLIRTVAGAQGEVQKMFADAIMKAHKAGFGPGQMAAIERRVNGSVAEVRSALTKVFDAEVRLREARAGNASDIIVQERRAALDLEKMRYAEALKRNKQEERAVDKMLDQRMRVVKDLEEKSSRSFGDMAEDVGGRLESTFNALTSGNFDKVIKGLGAQIERKGVDLVGKNEASALGGLLTQLGPAVVALGALAAGLTALIGIAVGADNAMKDLNRDMFEGGIAASELVDQFGSLTDMMDRVRETFTAGDGAFSFNKLWGTQAKDHIAILAAYAKAGRTLQELTAGASSAADQTERLRDASAMALAYSKLLGVSSTEMAETFATRMETLGGNIESVRQALSGVSMAAKDSGFGVKRFYSMVLEATSGMTMYNVRMEEAAGLLSRLGGILGTEEAGKYLGNLTKGFMDEGLQERAKRVLLTGEDTTRRALKGSSGNLAEDLVRKLAPELGYKFAEAAAKIGLSVDFTNADQMVKDLSKLNGQQQTELYAVLRETGQADLARKVDLLVTTARASRGGLLDLAGGLGGLDMGGKMMMMLQQGAEVFGQRIHLLTPEQEMAFQSAMGISGESYEQLKLLSKGMYGNYDRLTELAKKAKDKSLYANATVVEIGKMQEDQVKAYGAYVDEDGQKWLAKLDNMGRVDMASRQKLGDSFEDYVSSQGDVFQKAAQDSLSSDVRLAQEMVSATTELGLIIKQGVEWWLERIHGLVEGILGLVRADNSDNVQAAVNKLSAQTNKQRERQATLSKEISDLVSQRAGAVSTPDRERIDADLAKKRAEMKAVNSLLESTSKARQSILLGDQEARRGGVYDILDKARKSGSDPELDRVVSDLTEKVIGDAMERSLGSRTKDDFLSKGGKGSKWDVVFEQIQGDAGEKVWNKLLGVEGHKVSKPYGLQSPERLAGWNLQESVDALDMSEALTQAFSSPTATAAKSIGGAVASAIDRAQIQRDASRYGEVISDLLSRAGIDKSYTDIQSMSEQIARGRSPWSKEMLEARVSGGGTLARELERAGILNTPAEDMLMHVGEGRVKFAQRISGSDRVTAAAHKPGGPLQRASGSSVVINSFGNSAEVIRGIKLATAVGVL